MSFSSLPLLFSSNFFCLLLVKGEIAMLLRQRTTLAHVFHRGKKKKKSKNYTLVSLVLSYRASMQLPTACPEGCFPARNASQLDSLSTFWDALLNPNKDNRLGKRDFCQWPTLWILFPTVNPSLEEEEKFQVSKWTSRPAASLPLFLFYLQPTLSILQECLLYCILL